MSQNYNHYTGPPHSSQTPHVPADQNLDSLSESFIHPGRLPAIQQNYPQSWPETQNWQNQRPDGYNYNLPYQSHSIDTGTYFPNLQQQEFVPFEEEGEGSFINEDQGSHLVVAQAMQSTKQISSTPGTAPHLQTRITDLTKTQGQYRPTSKSEEQERASNTTTDVSSHKPDASARNDRAAELRAMLLAKRGSTPGTPSNQASKSGETLKLNTNDANSSQKQPSDSKRAEGSTGRNTSRNTIQTSVGTKVINTSPEKAQKSCSENANADTDIDGLLDEVRASIATSADQIKIEERSGLGSSAVKSLKGNENTLSIKGITTGKKLGSNSEMHQQSSNKSPSSSDTSEGEIRSESGKVPSAPHTSELSKRASKEDTRPLDEKDKHEANINNGLEKHSARRHEGEYSQIRAGPTAMQVHSGSSAKPYVSSPAVSQPRDQPQGSKYDYRRDRYERPFSNQEPRKEYDPDRRRDLELKDRNVDPRRPSGFRVYGHFPERVRTDNQIDSDARRPQLPRYDVEESARAAAEYKKDLEERRRLDARWVDKAEPDKEQIKKEIDAVGPRTPKGRVNEAQQHTSNNTTHGNDRDIPVKSTGEGANNFSGEIVDQHGGEDDDVRDWLEMTGYADLSYRKTALARFRKIKALDLQRAELEREALLESEGRSFIARPQSALPRESVEPKTVISPKAVRASVLAMPPPPLPTKDTVMKETIDDIGIKIKDSANRDSLVTTHIVEDETRPRINHEQNKTKSLTLKRFYSDDESDARNGRPAEKISRIDTNGRPVDSKAEVTPTGKNHRSLDNRVTRNEGAHERVRSRSPESRHRSPSPMRGRTFNYEKHEKYEKYVPRQRSRGSPARKSGYSPERQMYGQVTSIEKPRSLEKQPWCWNCERSGHVSRDCKITRKRNDNEVKQPLYEDSRGSPYFSRRNEVRAENDQESLYLGEYPATTTRPFTGNYYQQYHSNNYRGRGRAGRVGYTYANHRGGYKPYKPIEAVHDLPFSGGSEALNFKAGG